MHYLRLIPGWVWAALLAAALAGGGWLYLQGVEAARDQAAAERDAARAELKSARGEVAALTSALEWRRDNARQLLAALEQREQALAAARETIRGHLEVLDRLEDDDAEVGDWAAEPVPGAVARWLRELGTSDGAGAGDADGADASDAATPPPAGERDEQPGAARPPR